MAKEFLLIITSSTTYTLYDFDAVRDGTAKIAVTDATAGANTWTAAEVLAGLFLRDPAGADRTDTLPTAALLVAAVPDARVGQTFEIDYVNTADANETITVAAGSGGTLVPTSILIGQNGAKKLLIRLTNVTASSEAYTVYDLSATKDLMVVSIHCAGVDDETIGWFNMPAAGILLQADYWSSAALGAGVGIDVIDGGADGSGSTVMDSSSDNLNGYESSTTITSAAIDASDWIKITFDDFTGATDCTVTLHILCDHSSLV